MAKADGMTDLTHLNALEYRHHNEAVRLMAATLPREIALRKVWVESARKEIEAERKFLGLPESEPINPDLTIDEILAELEA